MFMKRFFSILAICAGMAATSLSAQIATPAPSPAASFTQTVGLTNIEVSYSRPGVKGRTVFGDLVPYGQVWRTGANAATTISFSDDVTVEGKPVKAGKYALYTVPGKDSWSVMLYSDLSLGGNVGGYDESKEVVRVSVSPVAMPYSAESFMIAMDEIQNESALLMLIWDKTMVPVKIGVSADDKVIAAIERTMGGPSANDYYQAAVYYYSTDRDMDQALAWINTSIEKGNNRFWVVTAKARILGKMGKKAEAIATSREAMKMAEEAGNQDYLKINADLIAGWQ